MSAKKPLGGDFRGKRLAMGTEEGEAQQSSSVALAEAGLCNGPCGASQPELQQ